MITFTVSECEHRGRIKQLVSACWEGREHWSIGQGGCADVARLLVGHGAPDCPWVACDVAGETLFRGASLHQLAAAAPSRKAA